MNTKEYLLVCLAEEASEIAQAVSKCLRFGENDISPVSNVSNIRQLKQELNDLYAVVELLSTDYDLEGNHDLITEKQVRLKHWIKYSKERGVIDA